MEPTYEIKTSCYTHFDEDKGYPVMIKTYNIYETKNKYFDLFEKIIIGILNLFLSIICYYTITTVNVELGLICAIAVSWLTAVLVFKIHGKIYTTLLNSGFKTKRIAEKYIEYHKTKNQLKKPEGCDNAINN